MTSVDESKNNISCDVVLINDEKVTEAQSKLLPEEKVVDLSLLFQALCDPTRIRIIHTLIYYEMCVCDLAATLEMTQSSVSHQLKNLRTLKLVKHRKVGRMVYYSLDDEHVLSLIETGLQHISHT